MPYPLQSSPPTLFPTYLLPSLPFRRRKGSADSTASTVTSEEGSSSAALSNTSYLAKHTACLRCARCLSDIALASQIVSKGFTGRHGRAYLVASSEPAASTPPNLLPTAKAKNDALPNLPNTYTHKPAPRQLVTGAHTVGDISCAQCGSVLGWKYIAAEEEGQKYKIGKFILETKRTLKSSLWEDGRDVQGYQTRHPPPNAITPPEEPIEFDSQDEEECEDLFLGVWTPQLARKRRRERRFAE